MYCPNCGKDHDRPVPPYCPGCGFRLSEVATALETGSYPTNNAIKKVGIKALTLVTISLILLFVSLILGTPEPSFIVQANLLIAVIVYLGALAYMTYKYWPRRRESSVERTPVTQRNLTAANPAPLAPAPATVEQAPSVTERTTTLLKRD